MEKLFSGLEKILQVASTIDSAFALSALGLIIVFLLVAYWISRRSAEKKGAIKSGDTKMVDSIHGRISLNLEKLTPEQTSNLATKDLFLRFLSGMFSQAVFGVFCVGLLIFSYLPAINRDPQSRGAPPADAGKKQVDRDPHAENHSNGSATPEPPALPPKETEVATPQADPIGGSTSVPQVPIDRQLPAPQGTTVRTENIPHKSIRDGVGVVELAYDAAGGGVWTVRVAKTKNAYGRVYDITGNLNGQVCSNARLDASTPEASMTCTAPSGTPGHLALMVKPTDTSTFSAAHFPLDVTVTRTP